VYKAPKQLSTVNHDLQFKIYVVKLLLWFNLDTPQYTAYKNHMPSATLQIAVVVILDSWFQKSFCYIWWTKGVILRLTITTEVVTFTPV
jgi:hypothetical protein